MKNYTFYPELKRTSLYFNSLKPSFLILLFFVVVVNLADAQSTYLDFTPDKKLETNDSISFDINQDGIIDFELTCEEVLIPYTPRQRTYKLRTFGSCQVSMFNDSVSAYLKNDTIRDNEVWSMEGEVFMQIVHIENFTAEAIYKQGNFSYLPSVPEEANMYYAYLGFKLMVNSEIHYAWVRINFDITSNIYVLDASFNPSPDEAIITGESLPKGATSLHTSRLWTNNGIDEFTVKFTVSDPDDIVSEYRVIITKENDETANDLDIMNNLESDRYITLSANNNSNHFQKYTNIPIGSLDKDGDSIGRFINYKVHILNVDTSGNPDNNFLSSPSDAFYLESIAAPIKTFYAFDDGNTNTAEDIHIWIKNVFFWERDYVSEYRVFILKANDDEEFNVDIASNLGEEFYTGISSTDDTISFHLNANQLDRDEETIKLNTDYKAYILSVADGVLSVTNTLSESSLPFKINNPNLYFAGQKTGDQVNYFICDSTFSEFPYWTGTQSMSSEANVNLDLNNDGLADFNFIGSRWHSNSFWKSYLGIVGLRNNKVLICDHPEHENWALPLFENEPISEDAHWSSSDTVILTDEYSLYYNNISYRYGHWNRNHDDYYIGLYITDNDDIHQYAWLHFQYFKYIDYGFINIHTGIDQVEKPSVYLFPNPAQNDIYIHFDQELLNSDDLTMSIINSSGVLIDEIKNIPNQQRINLENYTSGLYLFIIKDGQKVIKTQKVIIE